MSHLATHEIIGGQSFLTTELEQGSGIYATETQDAPELTNREAAEFLMDAFRKPQTDTGLGERAVSSVGPIHPTNSTEVDYPHPRVSQFISNLMPGYKSQPPEPFKPLRTNNKSQDDTAA